MSRARSFTFVGRTWYVLSCEYGNAAAARAAFDRLNALDKRRAGELELGIYRHALGLDGEGVYVSAVSHKIEGIAVAERLLVGASRGEPVELGRELDEGLVARRIRVMADLEAQGAPSGGYMIRRPERRGGILAPDGQMREQIGGDE